MRWEDFTYEGSAIKRDVAVDPVTSELIFRSSQPNLQECLDLNTADRNADRKSSSLWGGRGYVKIASIPLWLIEKWKTEEGINFFDNNDMPAIMRKLNSVEYLALRTAPGSIV